MMRCTFGAMAQQCSERLLSLKLCNQNFEAIQNDTYETREVTWLVETDDTAVCIFRFQWQGEIDGKAATGRGQRSIGAETN